jgi:hypothetical protein
MQNNAILVSVIFCINIASNAELTALTPLPGNHDDIAQNEVVEIKCCAGLRQPRGLATVVSAAQYPASPVH